MRKILLFFMVFYAVTVAGPVFAQATVVSQHQDWGVYSYQSDSGKSCYVMSVPRQKEPASLDHGDVFFFVSQKNDASQEPQFKTGYNMQEGSKVTAVVGGGRSFLMFTQGTSAWLENMAEEPQLVSAMRSGSDMQVFATSKRGNKTSYTFSLLGLTAALGAMRDCH